LSDEVKEMLTIGWVPPVTTESDFNDPDEDDDDDNDDDMAIDNDDEMLF
jgi:hypothetical protein